MTQGISQNISEDQSAFGIGIDDFNCLSRHGGYNITRTRCLSIRHVFNKSDKTNNIPFKLHAAYCTHRARNRRGTTHIPLHVFHPGSRLNGNAAGIKADPFTHQCNRFFIICAAIPAHHHHPGFAATPLTNGEQQMHSFFRMASSSRISTSTP